MTTSGSLPSLISSQLRPQIFSNGEVHDWYRFVWGYSDHLVAGILREWDLPSNARVLDPFCGTGTTLVECLKNGLAATGVDASPASLFVARTKTRWNLSSNHLLWALERLLAIESRLPKQIANYQRDNTYCYLKESGMLDRGWINTKPLTSALAIKRAISRVQGPARYRNLLTLALLDTVVQEASNVRFGPEVYVGRNRTAPRVLDAFASRVLVMASDLDILPGAQPSCRVLRGDSRNLATVIKRGSCGPYQAIICSPPYPAEHDYTRNARLELAFLESVSDRASVQKIKRSMIRSHTKGVYKTDNDWRLAWTHPELATILREIDEKVQDISHGFARLYSTVIASYFGGMLRHFRGAFSVLAPNARAAYVVSDQASYANVPIPTAEILADIAEEAGFVVEEIRHWRQRQSSTTSRSISENILIVRRP